MDSTFRMRTRKSMGNLHVRLEGILDTNSATSLALVLREEAATCRKFFINTEDLERVEPLGASALRTFMTEFAQNTAEDVSTRIYFKGKNGAQVAMEGQRVLQTKPSSGCKCSGKCKVCKCAQRMEGSPHRSSCHG
ncbi:hypothetical protein [Desulfonatronum lacustre]|uniref:hypothetical protein n=1 Tax=Desulfonatronum lacustre TaxID=66849 RepID=UPI0004B958D3|nr:hypothetical protein [Desulfonatronum lacustre]